MIRVLVVDDSALMRRVLGQVIAAEPDMEASFARDGAEALRRLHEVHPDVVTLDVHMPGMDGLACLDRIMLERPCPVLMVSAGTEAGANVTLEAMQLGAVDFIAKPAGAISLSLDAFGPALVARIRATARARLPRSRRLAERVRLHTGAALALAGSSAGASAGAQTGASSGPKFRPGTTAEPRIDAARLPRDSVVLVGASTGGPPALDAVLSGLPPEFPWPIVVAQHMPATFTGPLARRLDRLCALRVVEVTAPMPLEPGCVYIGRGDADVILSRRPGGLFALPAPADPGFRWHPSVDRLVASAMDHRPPAQLVGVLLTGMGDDGAASMTRLRVAGGHTIAEAQDTAIVWGMPGELVRAGGADVVAALESIGPQLLQWAT